MMNYHGMPQCYYVYDLLRKLCSDVMISCNSLQAAALDPHYKRIEDLPVYSGSGPAAGILTAFSKYPEQQFLVVGCDYPFLTEEELSLFLANIRPDGIAAAFYDEQDQCYQPVLAWYSAQAGSSLLKQFGKGSGQPSSEKSFSLQSFLKKINADRYHPLDPASMLSVDTPAASDEAKRQLICLKGSAMEAATSGNTTSAHTGNTTTENIIKASTGSTIPVKIDTATTGNPARENNSHSAAMIPPHKPSSFYEDKLYSTVTITRMQAGRLSETPDQLAVEEPLQIQLLYGPSGKEQQKNLAVTMRTPGNDEALTAGFLFTEGIIGSKEHLIHIITGASGENTVLAVLNGDFQPELSTADRNFYVSSSCGVCGKSSIDAVRKTAAYPDTGTAIQVTAEVLHGLPTALRHEQLIFQQTGGLHACALFSTEGKFLLLREDVGRHNALDKIIGTALLNNQLPLDQVVLLLSGRACFELIQKAATAGIRIIAAIGAPSSLAVELAREAGITLIGFLKPDRFNIYSGAERVTK